MFPSCLVGLGWGLPGRGQTTHQGIICVCVRVWGGHGYVFLRHKGPTFIRISLALVTDVQSQLSFAF